MRGSPRRETADAVVVGAGLSGLTAARLMARWGLDVVVLEARDRPGGRTHATEIEGVTLDLGGEWVDEAHAELRDLVDELGMELRPFERRKENARWWVDGAFSDEMPLSGSDARVYARMHEAMAELSWRVDPDGPERGGPAPGGGWRTAPSPEDDVSVEAWLRAEGMSGRGLHTVETIVSSCGSTVPMRRMSLYSYAVKVATRGGPGRGNEFRVAGGAGGVAATMARGLGERVRYASPVTDVRDTGDGVEMRYVAEDGPGYVRARRAVLAMPFTCYRFVRFERALPEVVVRLASEAVYGVVRKTFFVFDEPVDPSAFAVTDTALGYLSAAQPVGGETRAITSFSGGEPLLAELSHPEGERKQRALALLRRVYDVPEPVRVEEKLWNAEHFTRGSYMIHAPGDMARFGEAQGGRFGPLHLAGAEGYAAAPSFMNSAVRSGVTAARGVVAGVLSGSRARGGAAP